MGFEPRHKCVAHVADAFQVLGLVMIYSRADSRIQRHHVGFETNHVFLDHVVANSFLILGPTGSIPTVEYTEEQQLRSKLSAGYSDELDTNSCEAVDHTA